MFYQEKEINEIIICPYCKLKYKDPRILPCGRSLCFDCIELLMSKTNNKLNCPFCKEPHENKNDYGFYKNLELARLAEKKANEVYRSKSSELLKSKLNELIQRSDVLCQNNKIGLDKVKEHCNNLRFDIQTITEEILNSINEYNKELLKEVDDYENECIQNFENDKTYQSHFTTKINEIDELHSKWTDYLANFLINEEEVINGINEADRCMFSLDKEISNLKNKNFNGKLLKFDKNPDKLGTSLIGKLTYENISLSFNHFVNEYKTINLKESLNGYRYGDQICVEAFIDKNDKNFWIAFIDRLSNSLNLITIDSKGAIKNSKSNKLAKENLSTLSHFILAKLNENSILVFSVTNDNLFSSNYKLQKYDEKLNLIKEIDTKYNINHITSFNKRIYCLSNFQFGYNGIYVYDSSLNFIEKIGQSNENLPYYFPNTATRLEVNESYFLLLDLAEVKLISRNDGKLDRSIMVLTTDFLLYLHNYVLAYDTKDKILSCYDLDGNKLTENKFETFTGDTRLITSLEEDLFFYDSVDLSLTY